MELFYCDFLQNSSFSSYDIKRLFSLKTNNNNEGYELDKIQPEKPYNEKGSDDEGSDDEGSDDMEGIEDINVNVLNDMENEDLHNNDEDQLELVQGMIFDT